MDKRYTQLLRLYNAVDLDLLTVHFNRTAVLSVDTAKTVHESGFSGTVLTEESEDLAFVKGQLSIVQRFDTGEGF